jgi:hypothetical protein|tara:strand:- start:2348 stop:2860 length:513 start_codon:yes stop_codon:yes gene_type:complete
MNTYMIDDTTIISVVQADPMDALVLAPRLRQPDVIEVTAMGTTPFKALMQSFELPNSEVYTILETKAETQESKVIAMFGVADSVEVPEYGVPWMLASRDLEDYSRPFLRYCKDWITKIENKYDVLYNMVHCQNAQGMRWLQWCGFDIKTSRTYGAGGEDFYLFIREKNNV